MSLRDGDISSPKNYRYNDVYVHVPCMHIIYLYYMMYDVYVFRVATKTHRVLRCGIIIYAFVFLWAP